MTINNLKLIICMVLFTSPTSFTFLFLLLLKEYMLLFIFLGHFYHSLMSVHF